MSDIKDLKTTIRFLNIIEVVAIQVIVIFSLGFQVFLHDAPCSLCLLQRIGFFGIVLGLLMNLRLGPHPSHYSVALLSATFTSFVALRQIAINDVPDGGFGSPIFGVHLYVWSFIISIFILIFTSFILGIERQYHIHLSKKVQFHWSVKILCLATATIFLLNIFLLIGK